MIKENVSDMMKLTNLKDLTGDCGENKCVGREDSKTRQNKMI